MRSVSELPAKEVIVVAAVSADGVYSVDGKLPWDIPEEMKRFRELTRGSTVVMGRRTHASLPVRDEKTGDRSLPERQNIVISSMHGYSPAGCLVVSSLSDAIFMAQHDKVFCIGGARLWKEALGFAKRAYVSVIDVRCEYMNDALSFDELRRIGRAYPRFSPGLVHVRTMLCRDGSYVRVAFYEWRAG